MLPLDDCLTFMERVACTPMDDENVDAHSQTSGEDPNLSVARMGILPSVVRGHPSPHIRLLPFGARTEDSL